MTKELEFHAGRLPNHVQEDEEAGFKTINFVALAFRYRWWLVAGGIVGLMLGQFAYWKAGPEYEATAQILVARKNAVPVREEDRALSDFGERSEHIALIQSPMILNRAAELGKLKDLEAFRGSTDIADDIISDLKIKRSAGQDRSYINVLTITYASPRKEDARAVVNAVIAAYDEYLLKNRNEKSDEVLQVAQEAHDNVLQKLHDKEDEYHSFRATAPLQWRAPVGSGTVDGQTTTNIHQERVLAAEEQRRLNILRVTELKSRQKAIREAIEHKEPRDSLELMVRRFLQIDGQSGADSQRSQDIAIFENRLLPLILEEEKLTRDYGKDHPDVQAVRKAMNTTLEFYRRQGVRLPEEQLREAGVDPGPGAIDFIALYENSLRQEVAELKIRDGELAALVDQEASEAREVAKFQAKDEALNAELTRLRDLWGQLATQVNQVGIERDGSGYTLKQIAPVKEELSLKRLIKFLGGGGMFGVLLVAGLCFLREFQDTHVNTIAELRRVVQMPLLGTVARFTSSIDRRAADLRLHPGLRYLLSPNSQEAENYRSLRTALNVIADQLHAKVVQLTSAESGDGKTTTAANLAIAAAQSGQKVLLIDADLRRPTIHQLFQIPNEIGLVDALEGEIEPLNAVRTTSIDNLSILTSGKSPENPAELLSTPRLPSVLRSARDEYDLVLIDAPPLLAVSDPCVIGRHCDGLLMVVNLGKTMMRAAVKSRQLIETHGLSVLGVVANNTLSSDQGAYSDGDSYYRHYAPMTEALELVEPRR